MITTSKTNSLVCVEEICEEQVNRCLECIAPVQHQVNPLKRFLRDLLIHFLLFLGTDRWEEMVSLKVGDSHYMMRMDDIQNRWRHQ
ncbi:MAG: hypothetical protein ACM3XO_23080 [Bacteroidota bacterium]|jgi:hypothetical protein